MLTPKEIGGAAGGYGNGSDGVAHFTEDTELPVDANGLCVKQYRSLIVEAGVILKPDRKSVV